MNQQPTFSWRSRLRSFGYAFNGWMLLLREEHNARIHVLGATLTILCGLWLHLSAFEWIIIILCMGLVFILEILNTAIERLSNYVSPGHHPLIGQVKDLCAGGVLMASVMSAIIGVIIFLPKILQFFTHVAP